MVNPCSNPAVTTSVSSPTAGPKYNLRTPPQTRRPRWSARRVPRMLGTTTSGQRSRTSRARRRSRRMRRRSCRDRSTSRLRSIRRLSGRGGRARHLRVDQVHERLHREEAEDLARPQSGLDARRCFRSEEHTSELQSRLHLVCRLLLEKKKTNKRYVMRYPTRLATVDESFNLIAAQWQRTRPESRTQAVTHAPTSTPNAHVTFLVH